LHEYVYKIHLYFLNTAINFVVHFLKYLSLDLIHLEFVDANALAYFPYNRVNHIFYFCLLNNIVD